MVRQSRSTKGKQASSDELTEQETQNVTQAAESAESAMKESEVAAAVAVKAKRDAETPHVAVKKEMKLPPVTSNDVEGICLQSQARVCMGNRSYCLSRGESVKFDPSHASTLEAKGWIIVKG
jgi:hypothetical protein